MSTKSLEPLQNEWKLLYQTTLPEAARAKIPSQPKWPVHNDHCFARIILDNTVGITVPWTAVLKSPAYKNMSSEQLRSCIKLGKEILEGEVDLVELDNKSLDIRGKMQKGKAKAEVKIEKEQGGEVISKYFTKSTIGKRTRSKKADEETEESLEDAPASSSPKKQKLNSEPMPTPSMSSSSVSKRSSSPTQSKEGESQDLTPYIRKIALSSKTPFQKRVLTLLCQVPRGQYTTYGAISNHLSSSPRAVGNAIRNNPFAPHVPCHRILATGGGIGGFHGSWGRKGEDGLNDDAKRKLLRDEGVRFDGKGKVVGAVWTGFL